MVCGVSFRYAFYGTFKLIVLLKICLKYQRCYNVAPNLQFSDNRQIKWRQEWSLFQLYAYILWHNYSLWYYCFLFYNILALVFMISIPCYQKRRFNIVAQKRICWLPAISAYTIINVLATWHYFLVLFV